MRSEQNFMRFETLRADHAKFACLDFPQSVLVRRNPTIDFAASCRAGEHEIRHGSLPNHRLPLLGASIRRG
jgi:hypothetical protein